MYFVINSYKSSCILVKADEDIPIEVLIEERANIEHSKKTYHISERRPLNLWFIFDGDETLEIKIDNDTNKLLNLVLVKVNKIKICQSEWDPNNYLNLIMVPTIGYTEKIETNEEIKYSKQKSNFYVELYPSALVIRLNEQIDASLLFRTERLGILTDHKLSISGFVIWNLTQVEKKELFDYIRENCEVEKISNYKGKVALVENNDILIEKIIRLKNIHCWNLLFYGFSRNMIDADFFIDFALSYISQFKKNKMDMSSKVDLEILELASFQNADEEKILGSAAKLITSHDDIFFNNAIIYNQTWLYLLMAIELKKQNILY